MRALRNADPEDAIAVAKEELLAVARPDWLAAPFQ